VQKQHQQNKEDEEDIAEALGKAKSENEGQKSGRSNGVVFYKQHIIELFKDDTGEKNPQLLLKKITEWLESEESGCAIDTANNACSSDLTDDTEIFVDRMRHCWDTNNGRIVKKIK
jgi:hypothetical protein